MVWAGSYKLSGCTCTKRARGHTELVTAQLTAIQTGEAREADELKDSDTIVSTSLFR